MKLRVLMLEDSKEDAELVAWHLGDGIELTVCNRKDQFLETISREWDVFLVDLHLGGWRGEEAIKLAKEIHPDLPTIIVTGSAMTSTSQANEACKFGAKRFFLKDRLEGLREAVNEVHEAHLVLKDRDKLRADIMREQRTEILGILSAGLAHDMNNVLGAIIGGISYLRERITPMDERVLNSMDDAARKGADMVQQLMAFARGSNGTAFKSVTTEYLLGQVGMMIRFAMQSANIEVLVKAPLASASVKCDVTQITSILVNMAINARDAMPSGGTLTLESGNAVVKGPNREGHFAYFTISDTGTGIPDEVLPHIWTPYFTTKPVGKGTGLGLAMVKPILEAHNGTVEVETSPTGTKFHLYLPFENNEHKPRERFDGKGAIVLLVDDEQFFRETVQVILEGANYKVVSACNGSEALSHFRTGQKIDVMLTDLVMAPFMSGIELSDLLVAQGFDVPTVFMTGRNSPGPKPPSFLQKPFSRESLLTALRDALSSAPGPGTDSRP